MRREGGRQGENKGVRLKGQREGDGEAVQRDRWSLTAKRGRAMVKEGSSP